MLNLLKNGDTIDTIKTKQFKVKKKGKDDKKNRRDSKNNRKKWR